MEASGMAGPGGMGFGPIAMLGILFLVLLAAGVLVLLLRRAVSGDPLQRIHSGALRNIDLSSSASPGRSAASPGGEVSCFLVIPDITGYTQFMRISAYALAHAQYAVSALLSSVIEATENWLEAAKIEGDAVFLYGLRATEPGQGGLTESQVGEAIGALIRAFYRRRAELTACNTCKCEACLNVGTLEIKTIVHSGRLLLYNLHGQRELSGMPVIVAHRLLKSDVNLARYVLITGAAGEGVKPSVETQPRGFVQDYEGVGRIESVVHEFAVDSVLGDGKRASPGFKVMAADATRKLAVGLRAVGRAA